MYAIRSYYGVNMNYECFNKEILCYLPDRVIEPIRMIDYSILNNIEEIRLRVNRPPMVNISGKDSYNFV